MKQLALILAVLASSTVGAHGISFQHYADSTHTDITSSGDSNNMVTDSSPSTREASAFIMLDGSHKEYTKDIANELFTVEEITITPVDIIK